MSKTITEVFIEAVTNNNLNEVNAILAQESPLYYKNLSLAISAITDLKNNLKTHLNAVKNGISKNAVGAIQLSMTPQGQQPTQTQNTPFRGAAAAAGAGVGSVASNPSAPEDESLQIIIAIDNSLRWASKGSVINFNNADILAELEHKVHHIQTLLESSRQNTTLKTEQENKVIGNSHFENIRQTLYFELGNLILNNAVLFPKLLPNAESMLIEVKKDCPAFQSANAMLYRYVSIKCLTEQNQAIKAGLLLKKIKHLIDGAESKLINEHVGNTMANALQHEPSDTRLRQYSTLNTQTVYSLFTVAYQSNLEKERALAQANIAALQAREAVAREQKLQDELNKLKLSLSQYPHNAKP